MLFVERKRGKVKDRSRDVRMRKSWNKNDEENDGDAGMVLGTHKNDKQKSVRKSRRYTKKNKFKIIEKKKHSNDINRAINKNRLNDGDSKKRKAKYSKLWRKIKENRAEGEKHCNWGKWGRQAGIVGIVESAYAYEALGSYDDAKHVTQTFLTTHYTRKREEGSKRNAISVRLVGELNRNAYSRILTVYRSKSSEHNIARLFARFLP